MKTYDVYAEKCKRKKFRIRNFIKAVEMIYNKNEKIADDALARSIQREKDYFNK